MVEILKRAGRSTFYELASVYEGGTEQMLRELDDLVRRGVIERHRVDGRFYYSMKNSTLGMKEPERTPNDVIKELLK